MSIFIAFTSSAQWTSSGGNTTTSDKVGIGTTTPAAELHVATQSSTNPRGILSQQAIDSVNSAFFVFRKSRGTLAAPTGILAGDGLGTIYSEGHDGTGFIRTGGHIKFSAMGVSTGSIPTDLVFGTGDSGVGLGRMRITSAGWVQIGPDMPAAFFHVKGNSTQYMIVERGGKQMYVNANWAGNNAYSQIGNRNTDNMGLSLTSKDTSPEYLYVSTSGNVGVGTLSPAAKLHVAGGAQFDGTVTGTYIKAHYQDVAEWVPSQNDLAPGTVVVLDKAIGNSVAASSRAYDTTVAGVVSAQPGIILGEEGPSKEQVATTGRVRVKVDASRGPIAIGDLLVTSDKPGYAMRSTPIDVGGALIHRPGTIIGKALDALPDGDGEILVLLSLQ